MFRTLNPQSFLSNEFDPLLAWLFSAPHNHIWRLWVSWISNLFLSRVVEARRLFVTVGYLLWCRGKSCSCYGAMVESRGSRGGSVSRWLASNDGGRALHLLLPWRRWRCLWLVARCRRRVVVVTAFSFSRLHLCLQSGYSWGREVREKGVCCAMCNWFSDTHSVWLIECLLQLHMFLYWLDCVHVWIHLKFMCLTVVTVSSVLLLSAIPTPLWCNFC